MPVFKFGSGRQGRLIRLYCLGLGAGKGFPVISTMSFH
ncbi:hypothetical protein BN1221_02290 [Brenneria goodwinii]|uniref:Uncharacterized protein n=1 Tax=Brenneria goodwinii TaxID=1109412 RepID=A0A0G4JV77_9GAMM|nr:hypothetical protein BN1221_02290 [Brenneria goodwinii]